MNKPDLITIYQDEQQEWRWRRTASNGEVVATSGEGYVNKAHAIRMAYRLAGTDEVEVEEP